MKKVCVHVTMKRVAWPRFSGRVKGDAGFAGDVQTRGDSENSSAVEQSAGRSQSSSHMSYTHREAWIIFTRRYGGKEITVMTAMHRLIQLKIPLGSKYDKVEALEAEVCTAKRCLNAVETEAEGGLDSGS